MFVIGIQLAEIGHKARVLQKAALNGQGDQLVAFRLALGVRQLVEREHVAHARFLPQAHEHVEAKQQLAGADAHHVARHAVVLGARARAQHQALLGLPELRLPPGVERQRLVQQRTALRLQALFQQLIAAAGGHGGIHGIHGGGFGVFGGAFGVTFFRGIHEGGPWRIRRAGWNRKCGMGNGSAPPAPCGQQPGGCYRNEQTETAMNSRKQTVSAMRRFTPQEPVCNLTVRGRGSARTARPKRISCFGEDLQRPRSPEAALSAPKANFERAFRTHAQKECRSPNSMPLRPG